MKRNLFLTGLAILSAPFLHAEPASEITYGVEAVTGYRSDYVYRGFQMSERTLDFQIETEIAINDYTYLSLGSWYATETGDGDFDESAFFAHLRYAQSDQLTLGLSATYRSVDQGTSPLSAVDGDSIDFGTFATYYIDDHFSVEAGVYYDFETEGIYSNIEGQYSRALSDKTFLTFKLGLSVVDDYYGRNGLNDAYARFTLTYNISDTVSITPFLGTSILLDSDDPGDDTTYGGLWFEVSF